MKNSLISFISKMLMMMSLSNLYSQSQPNPNFKDLSLANLSNEGISILINTNEMGMVYDLDIIKAFNYGDFIKERIKNRFEDVGIKIVEFDNDRPYYYVSIQILPFESNNQIVSFSYNILVGLNQKVALQRNLNIKDEALTWLRLDIGHALKSSIVSSITDTIEIKTDEFIIEYLKVN